MLPARLAAALLAPWSVRAYDTLHMVDVASVVCPDEDERNPAPSVNLASGKTASCNDQDPFMLCTSPETLTDSDGSCRSVLTGFINGRSQDCSEPTWVQIDLGSAQTVNEVVIYQYTCGLANSFCGHGVSTSVDGATFTEQAKNTGYSGSLFESSQGTSIRFASVSARYVRVFSGMGKSNSLSDVMQVPFLEVEIFNRKPVLPEYSIGIDYETGMDLGAPHIVSFLRVGGEATDIEFGITDAKGKTVVKRQWVKLVDLRDSSDTSSKCKCTGQSPDVSTYGEDYGSKCMVWDQEKCDEWYPNALGVHCCQAWCYADPSCPDSYMSAVVPGAYFSYKACNSINTDLDLSTCPFSHANLQKEDPCKCKNVGNLFNDGMKSKFALDYGSSCMAWDEPNCDKFYALDQLDTWCCSTWCYVDETCPHAKNTFNEGMVGVIFWADSSCDQNDKLLQQCPYRPLADATEENIDFCECLEIQMPTDILPDGAPADYGRVCNAHDAENCSKWYPHASPDMWCCTSWCWVKPTCPSAQASTVWEGHYYSGTSCDDDPAAVIGCKYSDACKCIGKNTGIDTDALGVTSDYGKSCGSWDGVDCRGIMGDSPSFWSPDRNDWCCQTWCYVNESCPLAEASGVGSTNPWSHLACEQAAASVYENSTNTCKAPEDCSCLGSMIENPSRSTPATGYGKTCSAWDSSICDEVDHFKNISCCLPWCWVSELCPVALPSRSFPGNYYSDQLCEADATALTTCAYSDSCKCVGQNTGVDTAIFGKDYGKECAQHDATSCKQWWGPNSPTNLWNDTGSNDWCCSSWCYVKDDCPLAAGWGEAEYPFSFDACTASDAKTYDNAKDACVDGNGNRRRLDEAAVKEELSLDERLAATEVELESCEDFFLLDGRSPVELPDTWADARSAAKVICLDAGFDEDVCARAVDRVFEGLPHGGGTLATGHGLCLRLHTAAAASATELGDLGAIHAAVPAEKERAAQAVALARDVHRLLHGRAGHLGDDVPLPHSVPGELDITVKDKLAAALGSSGGALVLGGMAPERRMKGSSGGGGGGSWGGGSSRSSNSGGATASAANVRRRAPNRPVAPVTARRRATHSDDNRDAAANLRRRRSSSTVSHRRRATNVNGDSHTTPSGQAYGYTSPNQLSNNFGGQQPMKTGYGYTGSNAMYKNDNKRIAMYAAGGAAVGVVGGMGLGYAAAGGYNSYFHNNYYDGASYSVFRRRRTSATEWCTIGDAGSRQGEFVECWYCFKHYSKCDPTSDCYTGSGCNYKLPSNLARDDISQTGFMPNRYDARLKLKVYNVTGPGFDKANLCPPKTLTPSQLVLEQTYGRVSSMSFVPKLLMTLTQQDELAMGTANSKPTCDTNTNFQCKSGKRSGSGQDACYGDDEECRVDSATQEAMCFCKEGYCLDGPDSRTAACHKGSGMMGASKASFLATSVVVLMLVIT